MESNEDLNLNLAKLRITDNDSNDSVPYDISIAIADLQSNEPERLKRGLITIRKLTSLTSTPPIRMLISQNIHRLVLSLWQIPELKFDISWILTNLCSGNVDECHQVVEAGGIAVFLECLGESLEDIVAQGIWGLANIAGNDTHCRDLILRTPGSDLIFQVQPDQSPIIAKNYSWLLSNLVRMHPRPPRRYMAKVLELLMRMFRVQGADASDLLWGVSYITSETNSFTKGLIQHGFLGACAQFFFQDVRELKLPALRILGNITTGSDEDTQSVIDCGVLPRLISCLEIPNTIFCKEALWMLSNIAAGTNHQRKALITSGALHKVVQVVGFANNPREIREAMFVLANITAVDSAEVLAELLNLGLLHSLLQGLPHAPEVVLEGLRNLMEVRDFDLKNQIHQALQTLGVQSVLENSVPDEVKTKSLYRRVYELLLN